MKFKVIVPAFKRAKSLDRLLASLLNANQHSGNFTVLVSLDGGYSNDVLEIVYHYKRKFPKSIFEYFIHPENIGLRNHILWCGNLTIRYENVIVLEDDLLIDKYFFDYVINATSFYSSDKGIAGIALYSPQFNEFENLPFYPVAGDGCSTYFMQVPCSWGQIWTRDQWSKFYEWYQENQNINFSLETNLPILARNWPSSSWKKYFYVYLIRMNKYIVYPYRSYSTNCSDAGGFHNKSGLNYLQVPLLNNPLNQSEILFKNSSESNVKYDSYFEQQCVRLTGYFDVESSKLAIDIYSSKPISLLKKSEYVLTTRTPVRTIAKFPLHFKPIDLNYKYPDNTLQTCISLARSTDLQDDSLFSRLEVKNNLAQYFSSFDLAQNHILIGQFLIKFKRFLGRFYLFFSNRKI